MEGVSNIYTEQYIADLKRWNSDELYSSERISRYYKTLNKGVNKYFRRREYCYGIYVKTCKEAGVKPDKFVLMPQCGPHCEASNDARASFFADEIVKFINMKQTINDIIEENNRIVKQFNDQLRNKRHMTETKEEPNNKKSISIQITIHD